MTEKKSIEIDTDFVVEMKSGYNQSSGLYYCKDVKISKSAVETMKMECNEYINIGSKVTISDISWTIYHISKTINGCIKILLERKL